MNFFVFISIYGDHFDDDAFFKLVLQIRIKVNTHILNIILCLMVFNYFLNCCLRNYFPVVAIPKRDIHVEALSRIRFFFLGTCF